jgi:hypothetical protein
LVLGLDLLFSLVAGAVLTFLATKTDRYFAWTIKVPVTATFLGAGYLAAVVTLVPTYRTKEWPRVRSVPIMGFTLTATTLLVTLWHLDQFHLGTGPATARAAAWSWLVVYVLIPVLLAAVFVAQERSAQDRGRATREPLVARMRAALLVQAATTTIIGAGLVFWPGAFARVWPWPLPPVSAGATGAWLLTIAAGSWWALWEDDWTRFRATVPGVFVFLGVVVAGAARYPDSLDAGAWQFWTFFTAIGASVAVFAAAGWQQGRLSTVEAKAETQA